VPQTIARRPAARVRPSYARPARAARPRPRRRRSFAGAFLAYVLVVAFIGIAGWKLGETHAETHSLESGPRSDVGAHAPPPPVGAAREEQLVDVLRRQVPAQGTVGLYVNNLTTGAEAQINGDLPFAAASLYKLPIMTEVIRQARSRRLDLDQSVVVGRQHWVPGSGVLQARIGESVPLRELLRLAIAESDNIAAMVLLSVVGLDTVNQTMQEMGLRSTRLLDYRAPGAYTGTGPYTTTAADTGRLLAAIASGTLVDQEGSEGALRLMEHEQAKDWLGEGLPWWVKIAHKWGEIPGAAHDAGIIFTPRQRYVIVVLTEGLDANGSARYIGEVSRAVFAHFEAAP
jgi:beta-lactamase class A